MDQQSVHRERNKQTKQNWYTRLLLSCKGRKSFISDNNSFPKTHRHKNQRIHTGTNIFTCSLPVFVQNLWNFYPVLLSNQELLNFEEIQHKSRSHLAAVCVLTASNYALWLIVWPSFTVSENKHNLRYDLFQRERPILKNRSEKLQFKQALL